MKLKTLRKLSFPLLALCFETTLLLGAGPCTVISKDAPPAPTKDTGKTPQDPTSEPPPPPPPRSKIVSGLALGDAHACALADGKVYCWGVNTQTQLGRLEGNTGGPSNLALPVNGIYENTSTVVARGNNTCALVGTDKNVLCWGENFPIHQVIATAPDHSNKHEKEKVARYNLMRIANSVGNITMGRRHLCFVVEPTKALRCVGSNALGQLGNLRRRNRPWDMDSVIAKPPGKKQKVLPAGPKLISAGENHTYAVFEDAKTKEYVLYFWGTDYRNTTAALAVPQRAPVVLSKMASMAQGANHICFLEEESVHCMGKNDKHQLGPFDIGKKEDVIDTTVETLIGRVSKITAGDDFTCAIQNGAAKCWGDNGKGQLGEGDNKDTNGVPVEVKNLGSGVTDIQASGNHACAIKNNQIYCWGTYTTAGNKPETDPHHSYEPVLVEFQK